MCSHVGQIGHDVVDHLYLHLPVRYVVCGTCTAVHMQPKKHTLYHVDYTAAALR